MLLVFLLNYSYSGLLRSFFFTPTVSEPINDLQGILDKNIPWQYPEYGEGIDVFLRTSNDSDVQKFWKDRREGLYGFNITKVILTPFVQSSLYF